MRSRQSGDLADLLEGMLSHELHVPLEVLTAFGADLQLVNHVRHPFGKIDLEQHPCFFHGVFLSEIHRKEDVSVLFCGHFHKTRS